MSVGRASQSERGELRLTAVRRWAGRSLYKGDFGGLLQLAAVSCSV